MKDFGILKMYCRNIFLVGFGNFWYEESVVDNDNSIYYKIYRSLFFFVYGVFTILEIMAARIGVFPADEKRESVTFAVSHTIVMVKFFSVILNKKLIRSMNKNMVQVAEVYEDPKLMAEKYKIVKINIATYFFVCYGAALFYVFDGLRKVHEGGHFVTVVTYYPDFEDNSLPATSFRIFTTVILFSILWSMIVTDSFTMAYLIMMKYKFITLRHYFDSLRENFIKTRNNENLITATEQLTHGFVEGIILHRKLLSMAKDIDIAFGTVLALQLCQSSGSAVSLLLQIALSDQMSFGAIMKIILYVVALFLMLGLFLCNAGEITYQASLLLDAIFYCGWHECPPLSPPQRNLRHLVLLACAQAQQPLVMKAFKMITLSYSTFIQVLRGTYSVFALFYAQNK